MARKYEERKAKPANDAYTGMLVVSFAALLVGCAFLYLDYSQYGDKKPEPVQYTPGPRPGRDQEAKQPAPKEKEPEEKDKTPDEGKDKSQDKDKDKDKGGTQP